MNPGLMYHAGWLLACQAAGFSLKIIFSNNSNNKFVKAIWDVIYSFNMQIIRNFAVYYPVFTYA